MTIKHFTYTGMPSPSQFQKDSSITFAVRKDDLILTHLDWLLERYAAANHASDYSKRRVILCDVFLTANYWIKSWHEGRAQMKKERYPAVLALFEAAVNEMCMLLQCRRGQVAAYLEEIFGRDMTVAGGNTDRRHNAIYFDKMTKAMYRLRFKGGVVYHTDPVLHKTARPMPLDSAHYADDDLRRPGGAKPLPGAAPFIMTLEREFFMTRHYLSASGPSVFHSSYTSGGMVAAAGTMVVKRGTIAGIRPDSGHYKPLENNIVGALTALGMFGVSLRGITVYDYMGNALGSALDFMGTRLKWSEFLAARQNLLGGRAANAPPPPQAPQSAPQAPNTYSRSPNEPANYNS